MATIHIERAQSTAAWLDTQGEHFRAASLRALCHSVSTYRGMVKRKPEPGATAGLI